MLGKLLKAMAEMDEPTKNKTAKGQRYSFDYADLSEVLSVVKPALHNNGLGLLQFIEYNADNLPFLVTEVFDETQERVLSRRRLYDFTEAQSQGSGLTYTRRYELLTVFGLAPKDDDGQGTRHAETVPKNLQDAQAFLLNAERSYCWGHGIADAESFHKEQIMCRQDYRNDVETLTRIAMELLSDVG